MKNATDLGGVNAHLFAIFVKTFKGDDSIDLGKKGVVFSHAHIFSGMYLGPLLPYDDATGSHLLACEPFHAIPFSSTVSSVSGTAARFFMRHVLLPHIS
jgi:hypothetical protein